MSHTESQTPESQTFDPTALSARLIAELEAALPTYLALLQDPTQIRLFNNYLTAVKKAFEIHRVAQNAEQRRLKAEAQLATEKARAARFSEPPAAKSEPEPSPNRRPRKIPYVPDVPFPVWRPECAPNRIEPPNLFIHYDDGDNAPRHPAPPENRPPINR